jgi:SAM-dependent methyltransferase
MGSDHNDKFNHVVVPLYELDNNGHIKPNPLFHRPFDYLHSRCVEYPFAASQLGDAKKILDVGTVKSDIAWISWLENLPIEVHATDYDEPFEPFKKVKFHRGDLRKLQMESESFDKIIAVSVIEHIGLSAPQVVSTNKPVEDMEGDLVAFRELLRILKKGGSIIMTLPFGTHEEIVLGSARNYTIKSIESFNKLAEPWVLDYYEYQHSKYKMLFSDVEKKNQFTKIQRIKGILKMGEIANPIRQNANSMPEIPGAVTWRRIPMEDARATNMTHIEGVLCGVWKKL